MKHYRILEVVDTNFSLEYKVQKRFLGFLWWYTPIECQSITCHSLVDAKKLLNLIKPKKEEPPVFKGRRLVVWEEE